MNANSVSSNNNQEERIQRLRQEDRRSNEAKESRKNEEQREISTRQNALKLEDNSKSQRKELLEKERAINERAQEQIKKGYVDVKV